MAEINTIQLWNKTLQAAMKLPMVKVNRTEFLTKELALFCSEEQIQMAINGKPLQVISVEQVKKIANGVIKNHLTAVTLTSTLAGIPGGWFMAGTIPADLVQFYGHILSMAQKLLYLYGMPNMQDDNGKLTEEATHILTLSIGAMSGAQAAITTLNQVLQMLAQTITKQLPKQALTKSGIYGTCKIVAKWLGVKLTKTSFAEVMGKAVPLAGAPVSGGLTYWTFRSMANKFKKYLDSNIEVFN